MERTEIFELRDKYQGNKKSGYDIDPETGAVIVYPLDAVYKDGIYYSMKDGNSLSFGNYVAGVREYVGKIPLQVPGSGVIVYRKNEAGKVEVLLQLRGDFNQYGVPGGGIEIGETYEECAVNELLQETAYIANKEDLKLLGVYAGPKHVTRYPNGDIVFHTVVVFKIEASKCKKAPHNFDKIETKKIEWKTIEQIKELLKGDKVFPNNIPILEDIVNKFFKWKTKKRFY